MIANFKRLGIFILTLLLITCICACEDPKNADPFSAFSGDFQAEVRLSLGESSSKYTYRRENGTETVLFSEPSELSGYFFTKNGERITLSYEDICVEVNASVGRIAVISSAIFAPNADLISSISSKEQDGKRVTEVVCDGMTYRFSQDGTPILAQGSVTDITFSAEILSIGDAA